MAKTGGILTQGLFNNNGGVLVSASGNYCTLIAPSPQIGDTGIISGTSTGAFLQSLAGAVLGGLEVPLLDLAYFLIGGTGTGGSTVTFQVLEPTPSTPLNWVSLTSPAAQTTATTAINGIINAGALALRANVTFAGTAFYLRISSGVRSQ